MCSENWKPRRAVLFLDPYGTEVRWETIEAIAETEAIDLWVLFPLGGVNRMLTQSGEIPPSWRSCLDRLLGTKHWYEAFYKLQTTPSLFGDSIESVTKAKTEVISKYFLRRMGECFAAVADKPAVLYNSKNSPLYLFCFAVGNPNPKAVRLALDIASHILKMRS